MSAREPKGPKRGGRRRGRREEEGNDESQDSAEEEAPPPRFGDEEKAASERVLLETIELEGYEALELAIRPDRSVAVVLDCERKPVTLGSCTFMNRRLRQALEGAELPADHYAIEVASPGTKRPLRTRRHYERFAGEPVRLKIRESDGTALVLRGQLIGLLEDAIRFEPRDGDRFSIPLTDVIEANLDPYQDEELR